MNQSDLHETISASSEKVWDVLFTQFGNIDIHNPTMTASSYMNGATEGALQVVRHCEFGEKLFVDEQITAVEGQKSFRVEVVKHNLPFIKHMSATYELSSTDDQATELKMVSSNSFSPGFMKYLMSGRLSKSVATHLFGLKYYIETGNTVDQNNYDDVFAKYN